VTKAGDPATFGMADLLRFSVPGSRQSRQASFPVSSRTGRGRAGPLFNNKKAAVMTMASGCRLTARRLVGAPVAFSRFPASAGAEAFVVDKTADDPVAAGTCQLVVGSDGSLRQAIHVADTVAGPDTIDVAIPGFGLKTIAVATDSVDAGGGDDRISSGSGDDSVRGGPGRHTVGCGAGEDDRTDRGSRCERLRRGSDA
jgi:hypothetical protein